MFFRARIALVAAVVIVLATALIAAVAGSQMKESVRSSIDERVSEAQQAFGSLERMRGIELTSDSARLARERETAEVFERAAGDAQRQAAFAAVEIWNARLTKESRGTPGGERKADMVALLGKNGHVLARDLNMTVLYDFDMQAKYPAVKTALGGTAVKDLWLFDGHMYRVALAPVRSKAGEVVGALLVGYVTSGKDATVDGKKLGVHVAYFMDGKIQASSFTSEGSEEKDIAQAIFGPGKPAESATHGDLSKNFTMRVAGEDYIGAVGPLPGNLTHSESGFVVLESVTAAQSPVSKIVALFYVLGVLGFLGIFVATFATSMRFMRPLDQIETGIAEVINGNHEYVFESTSGEFEGMANALNVMVARLTGRPDPSDDDELGGAANTSGPQPVWSQGEMPVVGNSTGPIAVLSPENARIAAEPEDDYFRRTFEEYVAARKQNNEGTEGLTLESFTAKLRANEEPLRTKYNVPRVRFKVVVKDKTTTLKPIPIPN
jgi:hypothetical protein